MKYIFSLLLVAGATSGVYAQGSRWNLNFNAKAGAFSQSAKQANLITAYDMPINGTGGNVTYKEGQAYGADFQLAFFFTKKSHFGIGTGLMYFRQTADMSLDALSVDYRSTDAVGDVFRQRLTLNGPIDEKITTHTYSIPVVLKYRANFSKKVGFTLDAGILYNLQSQNRYEASNASFDYEAIYKYQNVNGNGIAVYDDAATPGVTSWLITADQYKASTGGEVGIDEYFATMRAEGRNVSLNNEIPTKGAKYYRAGSVGFIVQPTISFNVNDVLSINLGAYFMYQQFKQVGNAPYRITNYVDRYNSLIASQTDVKYQYYGGTLGLGFRFK